MTNSLYRPSGQRKGTHLNAIERMERQQRREKAELDRISTMRISYHCVEMHCAAPLVSMTFESGTKVSYYEKTNDYQPDLEVTGPAWFVVQTCDLGHSQRRLLP